MVTLSEIFITVVDSLPLVNIGGTDYKVNFFEGILSDVKEQMNNYKKINSGVYPCIWLLRDFSYQVTTNRINNTGLTLVFLIDTESSYQTPERLNNRINPVLLPIVDNCIRGLKRAGVYISPYDVKDLTSLGNPNADITTGTSNQARQAASNKVFADWLDGVKVDINTSYEKTLKLTCYEYR